RNPDVNGDTAERWYYRITDDFNGWQHFTIPLAQFQRRTDFQPGGAPDDGLGLDEVSGYAFGFPVGAGAQTAYLDDVMLVNVEDTGAVAVATIEAAEEVIVDESIGWDTREWTLVWSDEF